ncbi:ADP-ribosylglycohydrolase family protein [Streptomyces sp. WMMC500]|uniref:ADP-ribosylglycohydrolase family protein n=1 Tax=Streptomyces sp. WMMC500 TaxID=3015154 RepID=UPI00248BD347|nr:ADP-ribosylglycohydrolase family protein [Streptomyces sp. WMMC500]WBB63238.1 ADP-ribosylglycohydrolase family protein [Streptomyces sp. WMMC500]
MTRKAPERQAVERYRSRVRGCLLGGAIGDALGGPVEFWSLERIRSECGPDGVREYRPEDVACARTYGRITDDTQMTLFTVEGMIRASVRTDRGLGFTVGVLHHAYDRWLDTQLQPGPDGERDGWLITQPWLYSRRAPGNTCLSALAAPRGGERKIKRFGEAARNHSKGCGGVMRSAPFGLLPPWIRDSPSWQFDAAAEAAGYTHGHPTGRVASGALAVLVASIVRGQALPDAVETTLRLLREQDEHHETLRAVEQAVEAARGSSGAAVIESLGGGWVAEEALAMAVYAVLAHPGPEEVLDALALAVTHSGDSDSTGAICGSILGALHGETALPPELAFEVEGRDTILTLADDFIYEFTAGDRLHGDYGPYTRWKDRYPGW